LLRGVVQLFGFGFRALETPLRTENLESGMLFMQSILIKEYDVYEL